MAQEPTFLVEEADGIAHVRLNRPHRLNAISSAMLEAMEAYFSKVPESVRVLILSGEGRHFCSSFELTETMARTGIEFMHESRRWHKVFNSIQFCRVPVITVTHGWTIGGGMELALCGQVRVAESSTKYHIPEAIHGLFVGAGATVRVSRAIGTGRMTEMMLTRRVMDAEEGLRLGVAHYVVGEGEGMAKARELAATIMENTPLANWMITNTLPRIENMASEDGYMLEAMAVGMTIDDPETRRRLNAFVNRKKS